MKTLPKALIGTVAAGAMVLASTTPALAEHRERGGVSAGDVIAGALIIGGIAAIASAASKRDRDYRYDDYRYGRAGYDRDDYGYGRDNPRQAIETCVYATERYAGRRSWGRADVTDIRSVRDTRYGYEIRGRVAVKTNGRGWHRGDDDYGRGWDNDYRGWNRDLRGYDSGWFKCRVERGRVVDIDIDGIRGL